MNLWLVIFLVITSIICSCIEITTKKGIRLGFLCIFLLSLAVSITSNENVVPDLSAYIKNIYDIDIDSSIFNVQYNFQGFENGFMLLCLLIKKICGDEKIAVSLIYVCEVIIMTIAWNVQLSEDGGKTVSKRRYFSFMLSLWIGYFGLVYGMAIIRAGMAMSCIYLSYSLYEKKSYKLSIIWSLIALTMQSSSIILILGIIVSDRVISINSKKKFQIWWWGCVALWLSRISQLLVPSIRIISSILGKYIKHFLVYAQYHVVIYEDGFWSKKNMFFLLLGFLFIYFRPVNDKKYDAWLKIFMIGLTVTYLTNELIVGYRVSDMFLIFSLPLIKYIIIDNKALSKGTSILFCLGIITVLYVASLGIVGLF